MDMGSGPICEGPGVESRGLDHESLRWLCHISPYAMLLVDHEGTILRANARAGELFGYSPEQITGEPVELLVPEGMRHLHRSHRHTFMERPEERMMRGGRDLCARHHDGRSIPVEITLVPVTLAQRPAVIASIIDLSQRKRLEGQLREERDLGEAIIHSLPAVFYLLDSRGRFLRWNQNLEEVTGYSAEELRAIPAWALFDGEDVERIRSGIRSVFRDGKFELDAVLRTRDGGGVPYHFTGRRVELAGQQCLTGAGVDISTRKALEADLKHQATHDPLTGLVNRYHFEDVLRRELQRSQRYHSPFSLVMMDIDHFKSVNDQYGHLVGDLVLRRFADTLRGKVRASDVLARWGGEEFMLLLPDTHREGAAVLSETIRGRVSETPVPGPGRITVSLAVTGYHSGESSHALLKRLDDALYEAKRSGRNRLVVC